MCSVAINIYYKVRLEHANCVAYRYYFLLPFIISLYTSVHARRMHIKPNRGWRRRETIFKIATARRDRPILRDDRLVWTAYRTNVYVRIDDLDNLSSFQPYIREYLQPCTFWKCPRTCHVMLTGSKKCFFFFFFCSSKNVYAIVMGTISKPWQIVHKSTLFYIFRKQLLVDLMEKCFSVLRFRGPV